jgi:hypothetical protein
VLWWLLPSYLEYPPEKQIAGFAKKNHHHVYSPSNTMPQLQGIADAIDEKLGEKGQKVKQEFVAMVREEVECN